MSTNLLQKDVEQLVPIVLARAGYEHRQIGDTEGGGESVEAVIKALEDGIASVRQASPMGDPRFRLEKYLADIYLKFDMNTKAIALWKTTAKHFKTSYLAWTSFTDTLIRTKRFGQARSVFGGLVFDTLDWPEAIWEEWLLFEHRHGSVQQLEVCLDKIERAQNQVNAQRAQEAEQAAYQAMQVVAEQQPSVPASQVPVPIEAPSAMMDVDMPADGESGTKRKAEDTHPVAESSKKARIEQQPPPLKRDRENSTVFVADLPVGSTQDELRALFSDCGKVREVKFTQLQGSLVATVEFFERVS
jgi:hypothetical protein